jgi:hypothetical protein
LGFPGAEIPKPIHAKPFRCFTYWNFTTGEYNLPLGFSGAETPKHQNLSTLNHFGISRLANTRELALGFPGCRNAETPKPIHAKPFRVSHSGISRLANKRELALGFPGCRNVETPKPIHAKPFQGFTYRDFATGEYKGTCPWVSWVPKHQNLFTLNHFGVSHIGISRLANTRELALGFPRCRNDKTPKPIHTKPFRGFAYRDFVTGEYKGTCPWVSRVSKRRNTKT